MATSSLFLRPPGCPLDAVPTGELHPSPAAKPWPGSGLTKSFSLDPAALSPEGELVELSAGTATVDLRLGGEASARPLATDAPPPRYRVLSEVGRGGMGVVLLARDTLLGREVAVKVLLEAHRDRRDVVRRFVGEARITSRLPHHGIVPVHDIGVTPDGRPYFAMSLVHGQSLDRLLHERPGPADDLPRYLTVFHQVAQAVAYAHAAGVIHRDLKPGNIMVGDFGTAKVMDWGLAKLIAGAARPEDTGPPNWADDGGPGHLTRQGTVLGTPAYLPPEQATGDFERVDRRADVFGLGSILCEILTGHPPYGGDDGREVLRRAAAADLNEAFARLDASPVPLDLVSLAKWCLAADLAARPTDAAEVVEVMTSYLQADQRRAELDLVRFFELTLDLFCIAGTDGYFRRVNDNFPRLLGYSTAELTGRPFVEFVHPDDRDRTLVECERLAVGESCVRFANRYRHADGRYLWLEWNARAVLEEQAIYAVARDVTARLGAA